MPMTRRWPPSTMTALLSRWPRLAFRHAERAGPGRTYLRAHHSTRGGTEVPCTGVPLHRRSVNRIFLALTPRADGCNFEAEPGLRARCVGSAIFTGQRFVQQSRVI